MATPPRKKNTDDEACAVAARKQTNTGRPGTGRAAAELFPCRKSQQTDEFDDLRLHSGPRGAAVHPGVV